MALISVGALFVGSMEMVHCGEINPPPRAHPAALPIAAGLGTSFAKGAELGRFNMGSTVILLFAPGHIAWGRELQPQSTLRMGQAIGEILATSPTTGRTAPEREPNREQLG
jgi:phosphatidylserine decarboxylase